MVGWASKTARVAVFDVTPLPVWVELMIPVVLFLAPALAPVTVTLKVQLAPPATPLMAMPVTVSVFPPETTKVPEPPQTLLVVPLAAVSPAGNTSVKAMPVRLVLLGLVTRKVRVEVPPTAIFTGAKDFVTVGGSALTVKVAVAVLVFLNATLVVRTELGPSVLVTAGPAVADLTFTVIVQLPLAGILLPAPSTTVLPPGAAVTPPPQVVETTDGVVFVTPAG